MKQVVWKLFFDFEKEEKWINEMAEKGLGLDGYTWGRYVFDKIKPGEYTYKLELLEEVPTHAESRAYLKFLEEMGVKCVATYMRWVFLRIPAQLDTPSVYTDYDSRITHYTRVLRLVGVLTLINVFAAIPNMTLGVMQLLHGNGVMPNLYIGLLNIIMVMIIVPIGWSFYKQRKRLKKEKEIYE